MEFFAGLITGAIAMIAVLTMVLTLHVIPSNREQGCKLIGATYESEGQLCVINDVIVYRWEK